MISLAKLALLLFQHTTLRKNTNICL
uniref:Uncharacterized protein n=1 Tax=Anguilla anguilla TaxID=7936 RepID=A0A0E9UL51_ANGAN